MLRYYLYSILRADNGKLYQSNEKKMFLSITTAFWLSTTNRCDSL